MNGAIVVLIYLLIVVGEQGTMILAELTNSLGIVVISDT
jgi:hypothetical protein